MTTEKMTRRAYAATLGLAIAGARGRMSKDATAAIAKAEAEGMEFADTVYSKVVKPRKEGIIPPAPKRDGAPKPVLEGGVGEPFKGDYILSGTKDGYGIECNSRQSCMCPDSHGSIVSCRNGQHYTLTARWTSGPNRGKMTEGTVIETEGVK